MEHEKLSFVHKDGSVFAGAIFMSNRSTKRECMARNLFGLPHSKIKFLKQVKAGMILFLFEHEERKLYGVFEATSDGALNIIPNAFKSTGQSYPAQILFKRIWMCRPLCENEFRSAIEDNYYSPNKFNFGLSYEQSIKPSNKMRGLCQCLDIFGGTKGILQMKNFATIKNLFINRGIGSHLLPPSLLVKKVCSSSGPVRFIPGQFSVIKKTRSSKSLEGSLNNDNNLNHAMPNPGNHAAGSLILDGISHQDCHPYDAEILDPSCIQVGGSSKVEEHAESASELLDSDYENENELNTIPIILGDELKGIREEIERVAVGLLAGRAMTVTELRKKLRGKKYPFGIVESVVVNFKSRGLLNDGMFAESYTRSRWLSSTWGPTRIKHALIQKGVNENETDKARKQVFEDDEAGYDENMHLGMCKLSMDHLLVQASKQWLRSQNTCIDKRRARLVRWLQYRGFNWDVITYVFKKLESQYPT